MICQDIRDEDYSSELPDIISVAYRGTLLPEILKMPRRNPISFESAIQLVHAKRRQARLTFDADKMVWYNKNFVKCVSDSGFHIELSGDEFDVWNPPGNDCPPVI